MMKITVLCGGTSTERDVSLRSSEKVAKALRSRGHEVVLTDVFWGSDKELEFDNEQDISLTAEEYRKLTPFITDELRSSRDFFGPGVIDLCRRADIVFIGLHGANGEDGKVQAALDLMNIRYTGSGYLGSAVAMSKDFTKAVLSSKIPMPGGITLTKSNPFRERIPAPCVIKPSNGGSSIGVQIVERDEDYEQALMDVFRYDSVVLVEPFVAGRELTQGVFDGKALPPVEIRPAEGFYDYRNKYSGKTEEICPAPLDEEILKEMSAYSELAGRMLGLSVYYRLDYILDSEGKLYCLEVNTLPGMTDTSLIPQEMAATGIDYPTLCDMIIDVSMKKYN